LEVSLLRWRGKSLTPILSPPGLNVRVFNILVDASILLRGRLVIRVLIIEHLTARLPLGFLVIDFHFRSLRHPWSSSSSPWSSELEAASYAALNISNHRLRQRYLHLSASRRPHRVETAYLTWSETDDTCSSAQHRPFIVRPHLSRNMHWECLVRRLRFEDLARRSVRSSRRVVSCAAAARSPMFSPYNLPR